MGAAGGDERRDAARDDDRDRRHLLLARAEVAQQLAIEGPHQRHLLWGQPARVALDGDDPSIGQAQHPVGHPRDGRIVRDDHRGRAELCVDARDHLQDYLPGLVVESAGRLVAEENIGALGDRARDRDALLLAARQLGRESGRVACASPTSASASAGSIGSGEMSVTSATFSRAVRLGIRL